MTRRTSRKRASKRRSSLRRNAGGRTLRYPEGVMTEKAWVQQYATRLEEAKVDWVSLINRKHWNSLSGGGGQQAAYEAKLKKKAEKPEYRAWKGDDYFQPVSEETYDWAKRAGIGAGAKHPRPKRLRSFAHAGSRPWCVRDKVTQARYYVDTQAEAEALMDYMGTSEITGEPLRGWEGRLVVERNK